MTIDWRGDALCAQVDLDLFFPEQGGDGGYAARQVCRACPVVDECREEAIERRIPHGIWGDTSPAQRDRIRTSRRKEEAA